MKSLTSLLRITKVAKLTNKQTKESLLLHLHVPQKTLQLLLSLFLLFLFLVSVLGQTAKNFLANFFRLVTEEVCDQDLPNFLDKPKKIFLL